MSDSTLGGVCPICLLERSLEAGDPDGPAEGLVPEVPGVARVFGEFELIEEIARGGMGVVYRARQQDLDRVVALKIVIGGPWASPKVRERFLLEARTAAALDHPNIVPVYDYGEHAGHAFLSLRLVERGTLARALDNGEWRLGGGVGAEAVAKFCCQVAAAVHYAHQRGVLHRDLKPSNILIDADGRPLVTDFGLAKLRDLESSLTHSAAVLGTPSYMAPEQAAGRSSSVTVAADIYGLGAVLYEMLTGRPPFLGETPLQTVQQVAKDSLVPPEKLNPAIPRNLGIICLKCLRPAPEDRYGTAEDLQRDLERWLNREPIQARAISPLERLAYGMRRHPAVTGLSLAVAVLLLAGSVLGTVQAMKLHRSSRAAESAAREAGDRLQRLYLQHWQSSVRAGDSLRSLPWLVASLELTRPDSRAMDLHRQRWRSVLEQSPVLEHLWCLRGVVEKLAVNPDGTLLAACRYGGEVQVWRTATGEPAYPPIRHGGNPPSDGGPDAEQRYIWNAEFSSEGKYLLTACGRSAFVWEASTGRAVGGPFVHSNKVWQAVFDAGGGRFATGSLDRRARVFRVEEARQEFESPPHPLAVIAVAFSPDGRRLVTGCRDGGVRVFELAGGALVGPPLMHEDHVVDVEFHPEGRWVATASRDGTARLWDLDTGHALVLPHEGPVNSVSYSPDGTLLATASADQRTRIWEVASGRMTRGVLRHSEAVNRVIFEPRGEVIVSVSDDGQVRAFEVESGRVSPWSIPHNHHVTDAVFLPDGRRLATASADGVVKLSRLPVHDGASVGGRLEVNLAGVDWGVRETSDGRIRFERRGEFVAECDWPQGGLGRAVADPARQQVYLVDRAYRAGVWNLAENRVVPFRWATNQCLESAAFTSDGRRLLLSLGPGELVLWGMAGGEVVPLKSDPGGVIQHVAISPDDRLFATATDEPGARIWRLEDGEPTSPVLPHDDLVRFVAFSSDGLLLASAGLDGSVRIWTVPQGQPRPFSLIHPQPVVRLFFSGTGEYLATVTEGGEVRVWRMADGALLTPGFPHSDPVRTVEFSDDGQLIRTATTADHWQLWDVESDALVTLPSHAEANHFPPNVVRFDASQAWDTEMLRRQAELLSGARIGAGGYLEYLPVDRLNGMWAARSEWLR